MNGLCECGCGQATTIATRTRLPGMIKGQPMRFLPHHHVRVLNSRPMEQHHLWKGGRTINDAGYVCVKQPDHPRAHNGYVREHILIVEKALGHPLPDGAEVHHFNEKRPDNRNENLVACQDHAYHQLLHVRRRALLACGHPSWRKCCFCKVWVPAEELICRPGRSMVHRECQQRDGRERARARTRGVRCA